MGNAAVPDHQAGSEPDHPGLRSDPAAPARRYGSRRAGRHVVMTHLHSDCHAALQAFMERHQLSASGAVHHLLRRQFGLPFLPPFDQEF